MHQVHTISENPGTRTLSYVLYLATENSAPLNYSLRFRQNNQSPWHWGNATNNAKDGQLIFKSLQEANATLSFEEVLSEPSADVSIKVLASQVTDTQVFSVSAPAPVKRNEWSKTDLGNPLLLQKFYSLVRACD